MIRHVLAPNPGPMTLTGTNTYLVSRGDRTLVVDPGPHVREHLDATLSAAAQPITAITVTHHHADHTEAVAPLAEITGAVVLDATTGHGRAALAAYGIDVVATPGHTQDSVSFVVATGDGTHLLSGDTVLGTGPSLVEDLSGYLASLDLLLAVSRQRRIVRLLPGHGPASDDPVRRISELRQHRLERLEQVRAALAAGAKNDAAVVEMVYPGLDEALRPPALASVAAQIAHLRGQQTC